MRANDHHFFRMFPADQFPDVDQWPSPCPVQIVCADARAEPRQRATAKASGVTAFISVMFMQIAGVHKSKLWRCLISQSPGIACSLQLLNPYP